VDPRYDQHNAALAYSAALRQYLRDHVAAAIAADPSVPLSGQIAKRDIKGPPTRPQ